MMEDIPSQEMDRRLTEHFANEESRRLRAPAGIWSSIRSRLAADSARIKGLHGEDCFHCGNGAPSMLLPPLWWSCWRARYWRSILSCSRGVQRRIENGCIWRRTLLSSPIAMNSGESERHLVYKVEKAQRVLRGFLRIRNPCLRRLRHQPQISNGRRLAKLRVDNRPPLSKLQIDKSSHRHRCPLRLKTWPERWPRCGPLPRPGAAL